MSGAQEITVQLELPESVKSGLPVAGRLTITNVGDTELSIASPFYNAALNILVFNKYWDEVAPDSAWKAHHAQGLFHLAPGQSETFDLPDLTYTSGTAQMMFKLKKGAYFVLAIYHPGTEQLPEKSSYPIVAASNVVKLDVQ